MEDGGPKEFGLRECQEGGGELAALSRWPCGTPSLLPPPCSAYGLLPVRLRTPSFRFLLSSRFICSTVSCVTKPCDGLRIDCRV